ncbi:MAG: hypothetical protein JWN69_235, partial [Alphaproteobacteria bacterium]|nr:hypothetical protein [Alphaproteobacteria bacterium]
MQSEVSNLFKAVGRQWPAWLLSLGLLIGCVPPSESVQASPPHRTPRGADPQPQQRPSYRPSYRAQFDAPAASESSRVPPAVASARAILDARIKSLGRSFNGKAGIVVRDLQTGWSTGYNG